MIVNRRYKDMTYNEVVDYAKLNYGTFWPPDYYLEVPCGYCHSCQKSYNNQYRIRLLYECRKYPPGTCLFVTLTFDDDNLKKFSKDTNKAVRLFLDRLRKDYGKQIRHWFVCEFGTLHGRPHYHGILFNVPQELIDGYNSDVPGHHPLLASRWKYGFVFVGYVSEETCSYITKYVTKSINGDKVRPRIICSHGIGDNYFDTDESKLHKLGECYQPFMVVNGFSQAMPRYYYNKVFTEVDKQNMVLDRYIDPPVEFSWQGQKFGDKFDQIAQRRSTLQQNIASGLTPATPLPSSKRASSFDRFKKNMDDNKDFQ